MSIKIAADAGDTDTVVVHCESSLSPPQFIVKIESPSCEFPLFLQSLCPRLD